MSRTHESSPRRHKAHDDVEFLASSWNRLDVLRAVAAAPRTRNELKEMVDVSRVTLSRILSDLEERGWIDRDSDRFEATGSGSFVVAEVTRLLDNMATADDLDGAVEWLPTELFDFDLKHLQNATVITPDEKDLTAPTRRLVNLARQCTHIRAIPTGITHEFIAALRDESVEGELSLELVLPPTVFEMVRENPDLRAQFHDMAASEDARCFHYQGDSPVIMAGIFDERVTICGSHEEGVLLGMIDTRNDTIRSWVESYFDSRCAEARRLEPEVFRL